MSSPASKSVADLKKKLYDRQERKAIFEMIGEAEKKHEFPENWWKHIQKRHLIDSYTRIIGDKMYTMVAQDDCVFLPFQEQTSEDNISMYIMCWNYVRKCEEFRENLDYVDMITWAPEYLADTAEETK